MVDLRGGPSGPQALACQWCCALHSLEVCPLRSAWVGFAFMSLIIMVDHGRGRVQRVPEVLVVLPCVFQAVVPSAREVCRGRCGRCSPPLFSAHVVGLCSRPSQWSPFISCAGGSVGDVSFLSCCGSLVVAVPCSGCGPLGPSSSPRLRSYFFCRPCCVCVPLVGGLPLPRQGCFPACVECRFLRPIGACSVVVSRLLWLVVVWLVGVVSRCPIVGSRVQL